MKAFNKWEVFSASFSLCVPFLEIDKTAFTCSSAPLGFPASRKKEKLAEKAGKGNGQRVGNATCRGGRRGNVNRLPKDARRG